MSQKQHKILVFAQNKRGVLERISMLIRKKMYNLEQITASDTEKEGIKRLTIVFSHQEGERLVQIASQIEKIVEVIEARILQEGEYISREVCLVKIQRPKNLSDIMAIVRVFRGDVLSITTESVIVQIVGGQNKLEAFIQSVKNYKIIEWSTSGAIAMEK